MVSRCLISHHEYAQKTLALSEHGPWFDVEYIGTYFFFTDHILFLCETEGPVLTMIVAHRCVNSFLDITPTFESRERILET